MIDQPIKYRDYDAIELLLSTEDNSTVLVESISQEKMSHYTTWMEVERKNRKYSNIGLGVISGCIPGAVLFTTLLALVNPPLYSLAGLVACTVSAVFGGTLSGSCILRTNALDKCQEAEKEIADLFKEDGSIRHYVDSQGKSLLFYLLEQQSFKLSELLVNQGLLFQYDEKTGYSIDEIEKLPFTIQLLIATPRDYQIFIFNMSREVGFDRGLTIQIIKNNSSFYRLFEEELDRILQTFNESSVEKYSAFKALKLLPEEKIDFSPKILSILETSPEDLEEILKGNRPIFQELVLDTLENERARQFIAQNREDLFERFPAISKLVEKKYPRNVEENTIFYPVKIKITENGYLRILCNMHHLDQEPEYVARKLLSKGLYKLSFNSEGKVVVSDACLIIQVTYLDQVGVDAGGLRTHFFVNLFDK